jgi:hypothetical protein
MTTFLVVKNNAVSTLAGDINNSTTTVVVAAGEGARFPSTYPYHISIDSEILSVTNRSTDTFTVATRGTIESTSAASHSAGAVVALNVTAQAVSDLNTAVNSLEGGIAGNLDDTAGGTDALVTKAPTSNAMFDALALKFDKANLETAPTDVATKAPASSYVYGMSRKNAIINGDFKVSQRGTTFTSATTPANSDDTYLLDRWVLLSDGNDIVSHKRHRQR